MTNDKYEDLVQTKDDLSNIIIYCPFNKIEINNELLDCPNYPFSIAKENNITLLNTTYSGRKVIIREVIDMMHVVKEKVRLQLKPYPYTNLRTESSKYDFYQIMTFFLIICLISFLWYKIFICTQNYKNSLLENTNQMNSNDEPFNINR